VSVSGASARSNIYSYNRPPATITNGIIEVKRATVTKAFGDNGTIKEPDTHGVFDFCNDISPAVWPKIVHKDSRVRPSEESKI